MCHSQHHRRPTTRPNTAGLRASDAEREHTAGLLRSAAGDGRLAISELEERLQTAWAARTQGELVGLTDDLRSERRRALSPGILRHPALIWAVLIAFWLLSSSVWRTLGL